MQSMQIVPRSGPHVELGQICMPARAGRAGGGLSLGLGLGLGLRHRRRQALADQRDRVEVVVEQMLAHDAADPSVA